jgi:hypothetical protein
MSFLSPALFGALIPLAALPLAIHLLNKGFPRHFKFPSLELIKQTMAQRSRLHRWRHWILLLLRTAFLLLLLVAFLRPIGKKFGADPAAGARQVLIVLDHSLSMEHKGDGPTSRERAVHEAAKLIDSLAADDVVNVLLLESAPATCFVNFSKDHAEAKRFLSRLQPGFTRGDVNLSVGLAARLIAKTASRPEVYFLSDFQRKNWANASFVPLPPAAKLFFVDVGPARRDNRAILDARLAQTQVLAGDTVALQVSVGNFSRDAFAGRVTVTVDRRYSFDQEVSIAPWSEGKVTVPVAAGGPGLHLCEVRLPADALEADNHFYLTLAVQQKEEVLIVTDGPDDPRSGAYFLKTALNPFEHEAGSLLPRVSHSTELSASCVAGVRKMFFTRLNRLSPGACAATAHFLFQGGGLIYFLDGPADAENLAALEKVIGPDTMPLRLTQRRAASNVVSGAQQIVRGDFKSRYLKLFQGPARQNLALLEFYDYYQAGATKADGLLLAYGDDSPAMAVLHHGLGTMLLLNFSASEWSSNLARQRLFPAWMQELVKAVSADEPPPAAFTIGETLHTEVWRNEMRFQEFTSPSGAPVTVKRELAGERYAVTFTPDQLGFYTLGSPKPLYAFGINPSADEADLRPLDQDVLPRDFAADRDAHFVAGAEEFEELAKGRPRFHWFILGALGCLMLESGFQLLLRRVTA